MDPHGPLFAGPPAAHGISWAAVLAIAVAIVAALLLLWVLIRGRLPAGYAAAAVLLPLAAYAFAALYLLEGAKQVTFCGSCHLMTPIVQSLESNDDSLASIHYARGRVPHEQACFACHSGYGIWGGVDAKVAGIRHMLLTVTGRYTLPLRHGGPFDIDSCLGCHAFAQNFRAVEDHQDLDLQKELVERKIGCTGDCHPAPHPESALNGGTPSS